MKCYCLNSKVCAAVAMLAATLSLSGCLKEEFKEEISRYVTLSVSTEDSMDTKAFRSTGSVSETDLSEGDMELFVSSNISRNRSNPFAAVATKGAEIESVPVGFKIDMVKSGGALYKSGETGLSGVGDYWSMYSGGEKVIWPELGTYDFYAYYNGENYSASYGSGSSVLYAGPDGGLVAEGAASDAAAMKDFVIACTRNVAHDHANQNLVNLRFYHALAAVRFKVAPDVKKITISNVAKDGSIVCNGATASDPNAFKTAFSWTPGTTKASYSQSFSNDVNDMTFFIVPQALEGVVITFEIEKDGKSLSVSTKAGTVTAGTDRWDAGYIYNYTVDTSVQGKVRVGIFERFFANLKKKDNVAVQSTARSTIYVRAFVLGNWCDSNHNVVAPWDGSAIVYETGAEKPWFKSGEYYYFKDPLPGYSTSEDLIKTFTDESIPPKAGLHLELKVLAQGVEWDKNKANVEKVWGSDVASQMN